MSQPSTMPRGIMARNHCHGRSSQIVVLGNGGGLGNERSTAQAMEHSYPSLMLPPPMRWLPHTGLLQTTHGSASGEPHSAQV